MSKLWPNTQCRQETPTIWLHHAATSTCHVGWVLLASAFVNFAATSNAMALTRANLLANPNVVFPAQTPSQIGNSILFDLQTALHYPQLLADEVNANDSLPQTGNVTITATRNQKRLSPNQVGAKSARRAHCLRHPPDADHPPGHRSRLTATNIPSFHCT